MAGDLSKISGKKSSLENWSWKMCVDRDEIHNFKIGTGEVYGLSVREDTGGGNFLFMYFSSLQICNCFHLHILAIKV